MAQHQLRSSWHNGAVSVIRLGIWGCGAMGLYHAKRFSSLPGVSLVSCFDREPAKARELAAAGAIQHPARSLEEFLTDCDAVTCALIDRDHASAAQRVAQAGLALFMEKPLGRTAAETAEVVAQFHPSVMTFVVNFSKRNAPALPFAKAFLAQGRLGQIVSARFSYLQSWMVDPVWGDWRSESRWQWRTSDSLSCHGVLGDLVSHLADAARFLLGPDPAPSIASAKGRRSPVEGNWGGAWDEVLVEGHAGPRLVPVVFEASRRAQGSLDAMTITLEGTDGTLSLDLENHRAEVLWRSRFSQTEEWLPCPTTSSTYEGFVDLLLGKQPAPVPPGATDGHAVQEFLDLAHQKLLESEGSS